MSKRDPIHKVGSKVNVSFRATMKLPTLSHRQLANPKQRQTLEHKSVRIKAMGWDRSISPLLCGSMCSFCVSEFKPHDWSSAQDIPVSNSPEFKFRSRPLLGLHMVDIGCNGLWCVVWSRFVENGLLIMTHLCQCQRAKHLGNVSPNLCGSFILDWLAVN